MVKVILKGHSVEDGLTECPSPEDETQSFIVGKRNIGSIGISAVVLIYINSKYINLWAELCQNSFKSSLLPMLGKSLSYSSSAVY